MPKHVLVVKAAIFLFIDSASAFAYTQLQDLFPQVIQYVVANGLMTSELYLDSNAVECLHVFACEADRKNLFSESMIQELIRIFEGVYPRLSRVLSDKLMGTMFSIISCLPPEQYARNIQQSLSSILANFSTTTDPVEFTHLLNILFLAMSPVDCNDHDFSSDFLYQLFEPLLKTAIPQINAAIGAIGVNEDFVKAVSKVLKL